MITWEDLQNTEYREFRALHTGVNIPSGSGSNPEIDLWEAFCRPLQHDQVYVEMLMNQHEAPSFENFAGIFQSKQGNYSGGPSDLQYEKIQIIWKSGVVTSKYERLGHDGEKATPTPFARRGNGCDLYLKVPPNASRTLTPLRTAGLCDL